jgi:hypothetical protein
LALARLGSRGANGMNSSGPRGRLLAFTAIVGTVVAAASAVAADAGATPSRQLPAAAQGHPYRHGVVPRRGQPPAAGSLSASPKNLSFGGGISGVGVNTGPPKVYLVFWGSQWGTQGTDSAGNVTLSGDPDGMAPYLQKFIKGLGTGGETWSGVMTQYCQGISAGAQTCPSSNTQHVGYPTGGALAGVWVDESAASPSQSTAHQLAQEAINAAAHFGDYSSSSQYVVVSPTGTSPDGFVMSGFCAWHDYTGDSTLDGGGQVASPPGKPPVAFTNLPYLTDAGASCGQDFVNSGSAGTLDGVSIVEGHEYAETITDTFPAGGWTDNSGNENGDKCAWISSGQGASQDITLTTGSFAVQSTWANDFNNGAGGCEVTHPIVTDPNSVTVTNPGSRTSTDEVAITPLQMTAQDSQSGQTFTWSATGLPAGLTIDSTTGVISGTPTTVGSKSVTVTATDTTNASGTATYTWTITKRSTATSVSCDPTTISVGVQTNCTATVTDTDAGTASTPTGSVSFSPSGSCSLAATGRTGVASCQASYTPTATGTQTITAHYGGDTTHSTSTSSGSALTVTGRSTSTSVACSPAGLNAGNPTTCTGTVSDTDSGTATTPTGAVNFSAAPTGEGSFSGGGSCTLTGTGTTGVARCQTTYTPSTAGSPTITAAYQSDSTHIAASSNSFQLTVTPPNATSGSSSTSPGPTPALPQDQTAPVISGVAKLGNDLSCSSGSWTDSPISYSYQWNRDGNPLVGATSHTYTVASGDQGATLTCTVTATNAWGAGAPATSGEVTVASASSPQCPVATGKLSRSTLGLVRLGMTRAQARAAYPGSSLRSGRNRDFFCVSPSGIRVGYPSPKLLASVGRTQRKKLTGRVVWATTANTHYSAAGLRPGVTLARAGGVLSRAKVFTIGGVSWYLSPGRFATTLIKVKGGVVTEVGIALNQLTRSALTEKLLVRSLS